MILPTSSHRVRPLRGVSLARGSANLPLSSQSRVGLPGIPPRMSWSGYPRCPRRSRWCGTTSPRLDRGSRVSPKVADGAIEAFDRFGKSRQPTGLNFGDCFIYACARSYRMPLLYRGIDFARDQRFRCVKPRSVGDHARQAGYRGRHRDPVRAASRPQGEGVAAMTVPEHALNEVPCPAGEFGWRAQEPGLRRLGRWSGVRLPVSNRNTGPPPGRRRRRQGAG